MDRCAKGCVGHISPKVDGENQIRGQARSLAARENQTLAGAVWAEAMEHGGFWRAALWSQREEQG